MNDGVDREISPNAKTHRLCTADLLAAASAADLQDPQRSHDEDDTLRLLLFASAFLKKRYIYKRFATLHHLRPLSAAKEFR